MTSSMPLQQRDATHRNLFEQTALRATDYTEKSFYWTLIENTHPPVLGNPTSPIQDLLEGRHSTREHWEMGVATEFHSDPHHEGRAVPGGELDEEWPLFEHQLKTTSRYMSVA
jgi:hypothetical protein